MRKKNLFYYLLLTFHVAVVVADGIITRFLIMNRLGVEANPFLQEWVKSDMLLIVKLVGATVAAFILWRIHKRKPMLALIFTYLFIVIYALLILWNLITFYITVKPTI